MCGICGVVGAENQKQQVESMMGVLGHRGPDSSGIAEGQNFTFGHQRLAIIDLVAGKQPMQTEKGDITLVFNGEIYNYIELRQELQAKGVSFQTQSDTEVLLRLYEIEREKLLEKINGMFAFSIYDKRKGQLFAARDHFGIKPFYYTITEDGTFLFASEIKSLLQHPFVKPELDYESLQEYLTFQFCLGDRTLFKNIKKLEPATMLTLTSGEGTQPKISRYWTQSFEVDTNRTEESFTEELNSLLQDSVSKQLRSDVSLGTYLSGGLDSSAVTAIAAEHYGKELQCFTGRFDEGQSYDESAHAALMAKHVSARHELITPTADDFVKSMSEMMYFMDEPVAGPGVFPQYMVSKIASQKVKVVLGGQGGDEIFGGYARYLIAYLEQCLKGAIFETQEEGQHIVTLSSVIKNLPALKEYVPLFKHFMQQGVFEPMDQRYFRLINRSPDLQGLLSEDFSGDFDQEKVFSKFSTHFNFPKTPSYINKMLHFDQVTLLPALLHVEDRVSMASSLESRVPLLDYRIVELMSRMPPALKFKDGKLKNAFRQTVQNKVPSQIFNRRDKMGFPVPLAEWQTASPVREFVQDTLLSRSFAQRGLFKSEEIEKLLSSKKPFGRQVWGLLCLELWFQNFMDGKSQPREKVTSHAAENLA